MSKLYQVPTDGGTMEIRKNSCQTGPMCREVGSKERKEGKEREEKGEKEKEKKRQKRRKGKKEKQAEKKERRKGQYSVSKIIFVLSIFHVFSKNKGNRGSPQTFLTITKQIYPSSTYSASPSLLYLLHPNPTYHSYFHINEINVILKTGIIVNYFEKKPGQITKTANKPSGRFPSRTSFLFLSTSPLPTYLLPR